MLMRACIMIVIAYALTSCEHARVKADELTVKLDNLTRMGERDAKRAQMRQFLWDHWIERRPPTYFLLRSQKKAGSRIRSTGCRFFLAARFYLRRGLYETGSARKDRSSRKKMVASKPA